MDQNEIESTPVRQSHRKPRHRPTVENFSSADQAQFIEFCGALFKVLTRKPALSPDDGTFKQPESYVAVE